MENISEELKSNYNFTKAFLTTLLPYPSKKIVKHSDVKEVSWDTFFDDLDYEKLKSKKNEKLNINFRYLFIIAITTTSEFYDFILTYFSKKLMVEEKFKKLLLVFALSEKGLSETEIMAIVN